MNTLVRKSTECEWCKKVIDTPRSLLRYDDLLFCDEQCLGEYMVDQADGDIEEIWFDTPENIELCAKERISEY